jgi:uncharacterized coiled-coil protein SlyX
MKKIAVSVAVLLGAGAFLWMVKLMDDMTGHMARMTDQVADMTMDMGRMQAQMKILVEQVSGIQTSVRSMAPLAEDVHGLRESVDSMAGVIHRSGEQIERLNPLELMQQMVPPRQTR